MSVRGRCITAKDLHNRLSAWAARAAVDVWHQHDLANCQVCNKCPFARTVLEEGCGMCGECSCDPMHCPMLHHARPTHSLPPLHDPLTPTAAVAVAPAAEADTPGTAADAAATAAGVRGFRAPMMTPMPLGTWTAEEQAEAVPGLLLMDRASGAVVAATPVASAGRVPLGDMAGRGGAPFTFVPASRECMWLWRRPLRCVLRVLAAPFVQRPTLLYRMSMCSISCYCFFSCSNNVTTQNQI